MRVSTAFSRTRVFPAGTKIYRKALKSQWGKKSYKEHFDVEPLDMRRRPRRAMQSALAQAFRWGRQP